VYQPANRCLALEQTLANSFLAQALPCPAHATTRQWLNPDSVASAAPTALINQIERALADPVPDLLVPAISDGIVFCLAEAGVRDVEHEPEERLPLARALAGSRRPGRRPRDGFCLPHPRILGSRSTYLLVNRSRTCRCASARKNPPPSESDPGRGRMGEGARRIARGAARTDRGPVGNCSNPRSGMRAARHA
jgi:hypothetical protein